MDKNGNFKAEPSSFSTVGNIFDPLTFSNHFEFFFIKVCRYTLKKCINSFVVAIWIVQNRNILGVFFITKILENQSILLAFYS